MEKVLQALDAAIHSMSELCKQLEQVEKELSETSPLNTDAVQFILLLIKWRENLITTSSRPN